MPDYPLPPMTVTALAWEIDGLSPVLPLPFIRERRIWGDVTSSQAGCEMGSVRRTLAS